VVIVINISAEYIDVIKTIHSAKVFDYDHYGKSLASIHAAEVCMTTNTMVGLYYVNILS
jgi:hypothetical protein